MRIKFCVCSLRAAKESGTTAKHFTNDTVVQMTCCIQHAVVLPLTPLKGGRGMERWRNDDISELWRELLQALLCQLDLVLSNNSRTDLETADTVAIGFNVLPPVCDALYSHVWDT